MNSIYAIELFSNKRVRWSFALIVKTESNVFIKAKSKTGLWINERSRSNFTV